jgi:hypothetical protein
VPRGVGGTLRWPLDVLHALDDCQDFIMALDIGHAYHTDLVRLFRSAVTWMGPGYGEPAENSRWRQVVDYLASYPVLFLSKGWIRKYSGATTVG